MGKCAHCGSVIAFGGVREEQSLFCGKGCRDKSPLTAAAGQLPDGFVREQAAKVHAGACPKCQGRGPVDLHTSYSVWSAVVLTRWSHRTEMCCRSCGRKAQLRAAGFSAVMGWWGFPWGFFLTPTQLIRNFVAMFSGSNSEQPSEKMVELVRARLSAQLVVEERNAQASRAPRLAG